MTMMNAATYPRVSVEFVLTAVERGSEFVGQVVMAVSDDQERVIWESRPDESPTVAYRMAEDRLARILVPGEPSGG